MDSDSFVLRGEDNTRRRTILAAPEFVASPRPTRSPARAISLLHLCDIQIVRTNARHRARIVVGPLPDPPVPSTPTEEDRGASDDDSRRFARRVVAASDYDCTLYSHPYPDETSRVPPRGSSFV